MASYNLKVMTIFKSMIHIIYYVTNNEYTFIKYIELLFYFLRITIYSEFGSVVSRNKVLLVTMHV